MDGDEESVMTGWVLDMCQVIHGWDGPRLIIGECRG